MMYGSEMWCFVHKDMICQERSENVVLREMKAQLHKGIKLNHLSNRDQGKPSWYVNALKLGAWWEEEEGDGLAMRRGRLRKIRWYLVTHYWRVVPPKLQGKQKWMAYFPSPLIGQSPQKFLLKKKLLSKEFPTGPKFWGNLPPPLQKEEHFI